MSQSLSQLYVHLIFSTKSKSILIKNDDKESLHSYMSGIFKNLSSPVIIINSVPDQFHILFKLSKNHTLAKVVEETKKQTSKWLKTVSSSYMKFSWQNGYAAYSVSSSKLEAVKNYIKNQEEHHRKVSYKEEFERFMKEYGVIEYDAGYFWK